VSNALVQTGDVAEDRPALVLRSEQTYVTETPTGLVFADDTPIEVWGQITERLIRQHKKLEWAIGDAINFGGRKYGGMYEQWVQQTGLSEHTLSTIAWVAREIPSSRRREDVGWSHHREVAALKDPVEQDQLLDEIADRGMTRFEVRQEVKARKGTLDAAPVGDRFEVAPNCAADAPWVPVLSDVDPSWRPHLEAEAGGRADFIKGAIWAWRVAGNEAMFRSDRWRD
jgi:hypothetical protein